MDAVQKHLYVLILAGGGGTRLWPMSVDSHPKQFLDIFGGSSLFQLALERALLLTDASHIYISTSEKYAELIRQEAKQIPAENIICEPQRRDTALAEAVGAVYIHKQDPDAVICNFASDQLITPLHVFVRQMLKAAEIAYDTKLFTAIGIVPDRPHTGLGHMRARKAFPGHETDALQGEKFVEKPPLELAEKYTTSKEYYWNAHLFVWKAEVFLDLLKKFAPKTYAFLPQLEQALGTNREKEILHQTYQMSPTIATDIAVAENLHKFVCIPAKFTWSDVGDWFEVWKHLPHDENGNSFLNDGTSQSQISVDSRDNLFITRKKLVAAIDIHDLIFVEAGDTILICSKDHSQSVKKVVQTLKDKKQDEFL